MTDFTIKTPAVKAKARRARAAVAEAVDTVADTAQAARAYVEDRAEVGKAWTADKAEVAHHLAEERPVALAVGTFVAGLLFGFLLARNFDR